MLHIRCRFAAEPRVLPQLMTSVGIPKLSAIARYLQMSNAYAGIKFDTGQSLQHIEDDKEEDEEKEEQQKEEEEEEEEETQERQQQQQQQQQQPTTPERVVHLRVIDSAMGACSAARWYCLGTLSQGQQDCGNIHTS